MTRKPQESVVVGGSIGFEKMLKVTVLEITGGKVRLGFDVDKTVPVHRAEVWERIQGGGSPNELTKAPRPPPIESKGNDRLVNGNGKSHLSELPAVADAAPGKYGILVVDDEECVHRVLHAGLRQQGFAVWLATGGQEALRLYQENREAIDIVLLDLRMPGMDGTETFAALQDINPNIRCCFMSGDLGEHAEWTLCNLGAAAVLRKPFHLAEVAELLRELASKNALDNTGPQMKVGTGKAPTGLR